MSKINCLIGDIVSGFVRIEFILSQILSELGFRNHRIDFFADSQTGKKILKVRKEFEESDISNRLEFIHLLDELNKLREKRNTVVHSLVLTNSQDQNEYMFHNYQKKGNTVLNKTTSFTTSDLKDIFISLRDIHNAFYKLHYQNKKVY